MTARARGGILGIATFFEDSSARTHTRVHTLNIAVRPQGFYGFSADNKRGPRKAIELGERELRQAEVFDYRR